MMGERRVGQDALFYEFSLEKHVPLDHLLRSIDRFVELSDVRAHLRPCYICPAGKELRQRQKIYRVPRPLVDEDGMMRYRASKLGLRALFIQAAVLSEHGRPQIPRSIHEGARDMARDIAKTDAYLTSRRERKKVEMLFAHLKRILKLDRLRLRGPNGARDEFHLAATAQNLRKMAKLIPMPEPIPA
jgi:hypothetical protein